MTAGALRFHAATPACERATLRALAASLPRPELRGALGREASARTLALGRAVLRATDAVNDDTEAGR